MGADYEQKVRVIHGDCLAEIPKLGVEVDAIITDPPYHLTATVKRFGKKNSAPAQYGRDGAMSRLSKGFMGKQWDGGDIAFRPETWATIGEILRPGGFLLAFGGTRTHHRIWCAIEDAGFVIQDTILDMMVSDTRVQAFLDSLNDEQRGACAQAISQSPMLAWTFGSGFPKGRTQLKPAFEPICVAYKPGGKRELQVDECRAENPTGESAGGGWGFLPTNSRPGKHGTMNDGWSNETPSTQHPNGRWPANVCHDGSNEVMEAFAAFDAPGQCGVVTGNEPSATTRFIYGNGLDRKASEPRDKGGSPARFFYAAKASVDDRWGSRHPTVKPLSLLCWLVRLVTPPDGLVLDPFAGSGTTGVAALAEGRRAILIEKEAEYISDIKQRLWAQLSPGEREIAKADQSTMRKGIGGGLILK